MKKFLITYDLNAVGKDYSGLYQLIKDIAPNAWIHPLESVWCIKLSNEWNSSEIYTRLKPAIDTNDNLFIIEMTDQDRQGWMPKSFWTWIKE